MTTQLTNRFADPDQSTELAVLSDNPYAPPVVRRRGKYDHSLYWRIVKLVLGFIGFLLLMDAILFASWIRQGRGYRHAMTPVEQVQKFFTDWQSFPNSYPSVRQ